MLFYMKVAALLFMVLFLLFPTSAFAYIGPGAGLGAIATSIALIVGVILLLMGLVWYPLKRFIKSLKVDKNKTSTTQNEK